MIPIIKYISTIQHIIDDYDMHKITRAEWVDFVNDVLIYIGNEMNIYLNKYIYTHTGDATNIIKLPPEYNPHKIIKINRLGITGDNTILTEFSDIAIERNLDYHYPFILNKTIIDKTGYTIKLSYDSTNKVDGSFYIMLSKPLYESEVIEIEFVTDQPFGDSVNNVNSFDEVEKGYIYRIPSFLNELFKYLLEQKVYEHLLTTDPKWERKLQYAEQKINQHLYKTKAYVMNFKGKDIIQVQPLNFLAE